MTKAKSGVDRRDALKHPIQPCADDGRGVLRFKANAIVQHLLDNGGIDMNAIARLSVSREDREQFAQLIGYSLSGAGELGYVSDEVLESAREQAASGLTEQEARNAYLRDELDALRFGMRESVARLYSKHPDDLMEVIEDESDHDMLLRGIIPQEGR